jgi:hypothetical protein
MEANTMLEKVNSISDAVGPYVGADRITTFTQE